MAPSRKARDRRIISRTSEAKDLVRAGTNLFQVDAAVGWWRSMYVRSVCG
jgi:hypothetical protein